MPRFNAAKSWKKLDDDLSGKFNYLCDLLDEGYSSVALINNHEIAIDINPKDGIKIVNDGSSIFSLDPLTGEIVIGKYDGLISDLETDLGTAYNDIAQQLGYTDYDDMVAEAIAGNTIINGGWLRTSLIQANTILFDQLASVAVTSITDTIDLGGRNLLKDSDKDVTNSNYSLTNYTWANVFDMVPGEQYTITIEGTLPAGLSWYLNVYAQNPTAYPAVAYLNDSDKVSANKWVKTVTMPTLASGQTFTGITSLYQFPLGSGQSVSVTRIKIERGNKVTDWTPAPEDKLSEGVSYAGVVINATNGFVTTATIDGQTITTKSNSTEGFSIYNGTDKVFGVDTDGALFASRMAYIDNPERYYGIIGDFPGAGTGLALFDADKSANAYVKMGAIYDGSDNLAGFGFANIDSVLRMYFADGATEILNATGTKGILTYLDSTNEIYIMYGGASAHGVGADSTGPYYIKSGTKTYF